MRKLKVVQDSGEFALNVLRQSTSQALIWDGKYWRFGHRYKLEPWQ